MKKIHTLLMFLSLAVTTAVNAGEIARYKLDGNASDSGPFVRNGAITGSVTSTADRFGTPGKALKFNGGLIKVDAFRNYVFGNELTVSLWMRRDVTDGYMGILNNGFTTKSLDLRMGRESQGSFIFAKSNWTSGATSVSSSGFINIGQWFHVAVRLHDGVSSLFINGQKLKEHAISPGDLITTGSPIIIGSNAYGLGHEPFKGALDDIWLFDNALSDSDITALYNGTYQPTYEVTATLQAGPESVPNTGGTLLYDVSMTNSGDNLSENFERWGVLTFPTGDDYPVLLPEAVLIPVGQTVDYVGLQLTIPAWLPSGQYTYRWYIADPSKPSGNVLQSSFTFNKLP